MPDYLEETHEQLGKASSLRQDIRVAKGQTRTIRLDRPIELTEAQEAEVRQDPYVHQRFHCWQKRKAQVVALYGTFEKGRGSRLYEVAGQPKK